MTRFLLIGSVLAVVLTYLAARKESMRKITPKREERMTTKWLVQHSYGKDGDAA